jgi:hypothetical protein
VLGIELIRPFVRLLADPAAFLVDSDTKQAFRQFYEPQFQGWGQR